MSYSNSELSDVREDEIVENDNFTNINKLFDIDSTPLNLDGESHVDNGSGNLYRWDSDNEIRVSVIREKEMTIRTIWTKSCSSCLTNVNMTDMFLKIFHCHKFDNGHSCITKL